MRPVIFFIVNRKPETRIMSALSSRANDKYIYPFIDGMMFKLTARKTVPSVLGVGLGECRGVMDLETQSGERRNCVTPVRGSTCGGAQRVLTMDLGQRCGAGSTAAIMSRDRRHYPSGDSNLMREALQKKNEQKHPDNIIIRLGWKLLWKKRTGAE